MIHLLKRLLGLNVPPTANPLPDSHLPESRLPAVPSIGDLGSKEYFVTMVKMQQAISSHDYERAARLARENLQQVPALVRFSRLEDGSFYVGSVPALQEGGTMLALAGDDQGLREMRALITSTKDLEPWTGAVAQHEKDLRLFVAILDAIEKNPNCLQTEVKDLIGIQDGHRVANLIAWLVKGGRITRTKNGRTYALAMAGSVHAPPPPKKREVHSHRIDLKPPKLREIDISSLLYVPLPRAPLRWEDACGGRADEPDEEARDFFEVRDAAGWEITAIEKVPVMELPDTAFRQLHPIDSGLIMLDDLGRAEGIGAVPAAAIRFGRNGELVAKTGLLHDVYRVGVNALGCGFIAISRDSIAHAYDAALCPILETPLREAPEVRELQRRLGIGSQELKNHLRCVALAADNGRYLFTGVDEAWCVDMSGRGLWGVRLPMKEGWTRVASPSERYGTSAEVMRALELMGLSLPVAPEDLKRRYRELAKRWHPDLNPGDPQAEERTKGLTAAAEVLTGIDAAALPQYTGSTFIKEMGETEVEVGGLEFTMSIGMQVGEVDAADWIYAASFAGRSNSIFLAGYSGRVLMLDDEGCPVRAYDIGSVPRRIVDTGDYLYFLTDTRLYVLRGDTLHGLVDTSEGGDLVVAQTGFGLLEKRRFRWFREDGVYLGAVVTKDPIRRVYSTPDGMVVETRQRRTIVRGVPKWWK